MKVFVCVKHVPDTAATIDVQGDNGYQDVGIKFVANPYDEFGLEEAVKLVEEKGGEVVALTLGKAAAISTLRRALAMGAHRGILVKVDSQLLDSATSAKALKAAIEQDGVPDVIFTGKGSVDTEGFQTQYRLARLLGVPVVSEVSSLDFSADKVLAERECGSGEKQVMEFAMPCVIGATKGLNEPRYPKLPDIMKAKKKEVKEVDFAELGVESDSGKVVLEKLELVAERFGAKILEGSVEEQVSALITILKDDERVI
jgi:electron transfer flavoprotein beta subunit